MPRRFCIPGSHKERALAGKNPAEEKNMIHLTRLNHIPLVVNSDLIEHIEITPDTVIALTTGQKFLVRETPDEVIERVIRFRQAIFEGPKSQAR
ncbi:MAG TPA: flagellar FlbD family protein [Bryobacteraceae bacterium]|nr:flagellar FlbD family protein [Bryobacteraceae bacterium]